MSINKFLKLESLSGILLFTMGILALIIANSPARFIYEIIFFSPININYLQYYHSISLQDIINEGLMVVFFLLIGLEIKKEILIGELNSIKKMALPSFAAVGGILVPALIYTALNSHDNIAMRGWAIPTATDIAFSLGILSLLKHRIPLSLKILLTAIATIDDLIAVLIIAIYYQSELNWLFVYLTLGCTALLIICNLSGVTYKLLYFLLGLILWLFILKSGIHPTIAGVILAFTIPLRQPNISQSLSEKLEKKLNPFVAFIVLPLFALANSGVYLGNLQLFHLTHSVPIGIILGLFLGKQVGIFGTSWLAIKLRLTNLPNEISWKSLYGISILAGIGFTMSLFIGDLAFEHALYLNSLVRIGVIVGSILSSIIGFYFLYFTYRKKT